MFNKIDDQSLDYYYIFISYKEEGLTCILIEKQYAVLFCHEY